MQYKTNIILFNFAVDIAIPIYPVVKFLHKSDITAITAIPLICYIIQAVIPLLFLYYTHFKRNKYDKIFLRRSYSPSSRLFYVLFCTAIIPVVSIYASILSIINKNELYTGIFGPWYWGLYAVAVAHIAILSITLLYSASKTSRQTVRINSFSNNFKLGIIAQPIGKESENGLKKGEVVRIIKKNTDGYIVKNSRGNEYSIRLEDINEEIQMV